MGNDAKMPFLFPRPRSKCTGDSIFFALNIVVRSLLPIIHEGRFEIRHGGGYRISRPIFDLYLLELFFDTNASGGPTIVNLGDFEGKE